MCQENYFEKKLSSELHKKEINDNISDIKENIVLENVSTLKENMFKKLDNQSKKFDVNKEENYISCNINVKSEIVIRDATAVNFKSSINKFPKVGIITGIA